MGDRPKRIKAPEASKVDGNRVIADAIDRVSTAIREAFGPRVEMKIVHDEFPPLLDSIRRINLTPDQAERFGGHEETLIGRDDLAKITPFYETEGEKLKRLLAEIRARVLILSGYRDADDDAGQVAQNELAHERTDTVMAFFDLAQGHPLPRKLLPRGDRTGDWLPPGTPVTVLGIHPGVVAPEPDRVLVQMEGVAHPVSFPRTAIAKEGEPWTPPKPTA